MVARKRTTFRFYFSTFIAWAAVFAGILAIATWLHRNPEILLDVDARRTSRNIVLAQEALRAGDAERALALLPVGIEFYADLRQRHDEADRWAVQEAYGYAALAEAYRMRGSSDDDTLALEAYEKLRQLRPSVNAGRYLYEYGELLTALGRAEEAEPILLEALRIGDGGWVPEIQTLRAKYARERGDRETWIDCLYDLARYTDTEKLTSVGRPLELPADFPAAQNAKSAYVWLMDGVAQMKAGAAVPDIAERVSQYERMEPEDWTTRMLLGHLGLRPQAEATLPVELPLRYNYAPPVERDEAKTRFKVPGGTLFDFFVDPRMGSVELELIVSIEYLPPGALTLTVWLDDKLGGSFPLSVAYATGITVTIPQTEGRHRAALRLDGQLYDLENEPTVTLHKASLCAPEPAASPSS